MNIHSSFKDPYPGKPKILFIALGNSSHTHSWIDLLKEAEFNVRLFSMPGTYPPQDWWVPTYLSGLINTERQRNKVKRWLTLFSLFLQMEIPIFSPETKLSAIIKEWQPHIIHTLGIFNEQGGEYYYKVRKAYRLEGIGKWIVTLRGGSDLTLNRHDPEKIPLIKNILSECNEIISDNIINIEYAAEMGIPREKFASITPVPGTGGVDVEGLRKRWTKMPSQRERTIIFPKAYDCEWSLALPVFEALKLCWERIQPCKVYILAMTPSSRSWYYALPTHIREHCTTHNRLPHADLIKLLIQSRVMLAPSLVDGIPNTIYEAMACGAVPIVSPLPTIATIAENETNCLFTRNLYPSEIADALILAMNNDKLIDQIACNNLVLVNNLANRHIIRKKVIQYYSFNQIAE